jgi:hypothetical protein
MVLVSAVARHDERIRATGVAHAVHRRTPAAHDLGDDHLDLVGQRMPVGDVGPGPPHELVVSSIELLTDLFGDPAAGV